MEPDRRRNRGRDRRTAAQIVANITQDRFAGSHAGFLSTLISLLRSFHNSRKLFGGGLGNSRWLSQAATGPICGTGNLLPNLSALCQSFGRTARYANAENAARSI